MVVCLDAAESGVSILHGNCGAFTGRGDPLLRAVFNFWKEVKLEQVNRTAVFKQLQKVVQDFQLK